MTASALAWAFGGAFCLVAFKAAQQLNVMSGRYWAVPVVGLGLAVFEVGLVRVMVEGGWAVVLPVWVGATLGCWLAMRLHAAWRRRKER